MSISQLLYLIRWTCDRQPNNLKEGWFTACYDPFNRDLILAWYTWEKKKLCFKPKEIYGVARCFFHSKEKLTAKGVLLRLEMMKLSAEL